MFPTSISGSLELEGSILVSLLSCSRKSESGSTLRERLASSIAESVDFRAASGAHQLETLAMVVRAPSRSSVAVPSASCTASRRRGSGSYRP